MDKEVLKAELEVALEEAKLMLEAEKTELRSRFSKANPYSLVDNKGRPVLFKYVKLKADILATMAQLEAIDSW